MLLRFPDWPQRLSAFIAERRSLPYQYGANDCGGFVIDGIYAVTGTLLVPEAGRPATRLGVVRFLAPYGGSVEIWIDSLLGERLPTPKLAQRGDVISFEADGGLHLALVAGSAAATPGPSGLLWVPRGLWTSGWKVA
jgi:hypothetical protein